jgi:hypothetical protein
VGSKVVALPAPPEKDAQMGAASENILPVTVTAHILPSSPLHSSGLSADKSTRHLVRLSLPTAQFQRPTLQDPLTGEMRTALPRPKWLVDLHERGAVVDVRVVPLSKPDGKVNAKDADDVKDVNDASGKSKGKGPMSILYNDVEVKVQSDSESFGSLGRDELTDDRFGKMATISTVDEATEESLPSELVDPVAVAQNLLGSTSPYLPSLKAATPGVEEKDAPSVSTDSLATNNVSLCASLPSLPLLVTLTHYHWYSHSGPSQLSRPNGSLTAFINHLLPGLLEFISGSPDPARVLRASRCTCGKCFCTEHGHRYRREERRQRNTWAFHGYKS